MFKPKGRMTFDSHVHANGMIDDEGVLVLAEKYKVDLKNYSPFIQPDGHRVWGDYHEFHKAYDAGVSLIRQPEDLYYVVKKYAVTAAAENCIGQDVFASNMNNFRSGDPWPVFRDNSLAMMQAMREARDETGIETSVAITFKRHLKNAVAAAHQLVDQTVRFKEAGLDTENRINAFHLAGDELTSPPFRTFWEVYKRGFKELGFNRNGAHVDETALKSDIDLPTAKQVIAFAKVRHATNAANIREVLSNQHISRLGHALSGVKDTEIMEEMRDKGVAVEILPGMNALLLGLDLTRHPMLIYIANGNAVLLGSDDPGLSHGRKEPGKKNSGIAREFDLAANEIGLSEKRLCRVNIDAVRHSFAPLPRRQEMMKRVASYAAENGFEFGRAAYDLGPLSTPQIANRKALAAQMFQAISVA